jgi:hypothetical protein
VAKSLYSRLAALENHTQVTSKTIHGMSAETWRAIIESASCNTVGVALSRKVVMLEHASPSSPDLPRLRAERAANWRAWIEERFGAEAATAFFDESKPRAPRA